MSWRTTLHLESSCWTNKAEQARCSLHRAFASQKVLMEILALLGADVEWEHGEGGSREKAPIIKAAFWFDRKLFSSHRHLRSRPNSPHPFSLPLSSLLLPLLRSRSFSKRGTHYSRALADVSVDR